MSQESFGERLIRLRNARGLSMRFVASETSISLAFVHQLETGKSNPSARTLKALADIYGMTMDELYLGHERVKKQA